MNIVLKVTYLHCMAKALHTSVLDGTIGSFSAQVFVMKKSMIDEARNN